MNNYFRWKDIVVYHTFNTFILGGSFRIRYIVLKISSGRSKCFGCDIFAKLMFFWAWLSAKPKLFELDMFARLTLPWGWLNAKSRLFKSDMFTRCMLSWVWLTIKSNFFFILHACQIYTALNLADYQTHIFLYLAWLTDLFDVAKIFSIYKNFNKIF